MFVSVGKDAAEAIGARGAKRKARRVGQSKRARGGDCMGEKAQLKSRSRRAGAVAQMGERCNRTAEVSGSIPLSSTSPSHVKSKHFSPAS